MPTCLIAIMSAHWHFSSQLMLSTLKQVVTVLTKWSAGAAIGVTLPSSITLTAVDTNTCSWHTGLLTTAIVVVTWIQRCQHKHNLFIRSAKKTLPVQYNTIKYKRHL